MKWEATAMVQDSTRHGVNASLKTTILSRINATGSKPSPARINITTNASCLQK